MRSHYIFLLVYLLGICYGASNAQRNETCTTRETCVQVPDSTSHFLQCVGLPATDTGGDHMRRLKGMLEATMDVYTFMRSSMTGVPLLNLQGALDLRPDVDPLQNEALVQMWLEVKIKPLLKSITKQFLSCLSTKNFSCSTYQTVVRELSHHFSEMDPIRQKWIYTFFMYPFLSEDRVAGCVSPQESSEEWLIKNFGAFSAMARMKDFSTLNLVFSGLEVLHLLSPAQKAELLLRPEVAGLDNGTLSLVFHSLLTGGSGPPPTMSPPGGHNWTTPISIYHPHPPQHPFGEVVSGFMAAFRPIQSFVHDFVSFTQERDVSQIRSTTLTQFLMNWTLAELADIYRPQNASVVPETPNFDVMNVEDWYRQVVMPLLRRFLPNDDALMHQNITLAFHEVFYLDHGKDTETSVIQDVCSITLDKSPCGLTDAVQNVAHVLHCAARTNLTMSEATIMRLIEELTQRLNSLIMELSKANFRELASDFNEIFREEESTSLTKEHLQDPDFIKLWFKIKLMPLLPDIPPALLSCLSTKNFSCPVYQTIVADLSKHIFTSFMDADPMYGQNIYKNFIFSFLLQNNTSDPQCLSSANNSAEWLKNNFGFFSRFATVTEFYMLNPHFSGLEVLHLLTPKQIAEMLLLPLPTPPEKDVVINQVFDFLMESPEQLPEVLHHVVLLSREVNLPCGVYKHIFERLYSAIPSLPADFEPATWAGINELINIAPDVCVPEITCPAIHFNAAEICRGIDSSDLESYFNTSGSMDVPCNFTLEKYACARLENFTAHQLVSLLKCDLPGNSSHSDVLWKMLLTKLSNVLNPALDILANMSMPMVGPSASEVLDVISEIRVSMLTDEQLMNNREIRKWFSERLSPFLPFASGRFLQCLTHRNISCQTYQQIVQILSHLQSHMTPPRQMSVYTHFIKVFLTRNHTADPQCLSSANNSAEWLKNNFGFFSRFATVTEFYMLNPHFSGLEVLHLLTPKQIAEMLLLPLPTPPEKDVVINQVFDFLMESPEQLPEVLHHVVLLSREVNLPCGVYKHIFERLYSAIPSLPPDFEPATWAGINELINIAPGACAPENITCPAIHFNAAEICRGIDSSDLEFYFNTSGSMDVPCNFTLEKYACARLENFTAHQLVSLLKCDLPGNSSHSDVLWKMLLTKLSNVLNPALDILANMSMPMVGPSASEVLDVISEIRVSMLTDEQLMNSREIRKWFSERLSPFLPFASGRFLQCLTHRNISCQTYQQILQVFIHQFDDMTLKQQHMVLKDFVLRFLSQPHSGPGCVNGSMGSAEWLMENLGPFSQFLTLGELLHLNPRFNPMEALRLLTPKQSAELLVLSLPNLPEKSVIINMLFDYLTEPPEHQKFSEFLSNLVPLLQRGNLSCSSYETLFARMDLAMPIVPLDIASVITYSKMALSKHLPPGCIMYSGECSVTMTNETDICVGVNSTMVQRLLDSGKMKGRFCDFAVEEFACASLSALTAEDLAAMLMCNRSSNSSGSRPVWKLLLSKASLVLNEALDLLASKTLDPQNPALPMILDSIREIRLDAFSIASLNNPAFIQQWFNSRLRPFLPAVSPDFLSCLTTKGLNCSTYQHIVKILSQLQPDMTLPRQMSVYTHFIKVFLTRNDTDPSCSLHTKNSGEWLQMNLGGFSSLVSFHDIQMLYSNFSAMEALPQLTVRQLAEVSATPGQLTSPAQVQMVMNHVPSQQLPAFFDDFSPAIMGHENMFSPPVRSAMLQVVFDRANLSDHSVSDAVVLLWLQKRLRPLLVNLSPQHVAPFFGILTGRNCSIEQQGVEDLNSTISSLNEDTKKEIYNHIIQTLRGPVPLRCYGDNYNHSFYSFMERSFMGFQFPNLTTFLSLMPHDRMHQLVNSMPPSAVGDLLRRPDVVDNDAQLCVLYNNYVQIQTFLEIESLPEVVGQPTLPCVWPMALRSSKRSEVNTWFDRSLHNYLVFLTKSLISPSITYNATCLAFQKLVSVLGEYNYTAADFVRQDVFSTIRVYLTSATVPRCYNPSDPELNSTAWFAEYIGPFIPFLTLEDLQSFGSAEVIQVFTVNPLNIALLNHSALPLNLTNYYTELVYQQDSNFNPLYLPLLFRCVAPGQAFVQLNAEESMIVLHNLTTLCTNLDPQVAAALASNFGDNIDSTAISALGKESIGISTGQLKTIKPKDLFDSLTILSTVNGWNSGQAKAIIQSLMSSGFLQINSMSSLFTLGSLIVGVPAGVFTTISGSQLISASQNPSFLTYFLTVPQVVRETYVTQIIKVNSNSETIIQNVPDEMATEIPRTMLLGFSNNNSVIKRLNKKKWKKQQVELFFDVIAVEGSTTELGGVNNLSSSVLQGFTCTTVRTVKKVQIKKLIKACRRRGNNKVLLAETQLTCMYNYIKADSDVTSFDLYPPDVLLYYDYTLVPRASCRSYFEQLADADFSVFSSALSYKRTALFNNARSCLGITNTSLTKDDIMVLGNMCCTLDGSYIENSDSSILEKLNNCPDLNDGQASAVQTLLLSGKTQYGVPSTWNEQTLQDLGMLPLYMKSAFYDNFDKKTKRRFLKFFLKVLKKNGVGRRKKRMLKREIRKSIRNKAKRSIVNECTVGTITQVTISDDTFPFDYDDINQFNCCLSAATVQENLDAITTKVDQEEYLMIVLSKLQEAYAASSTIPEDQVQLLGPASRLATVDNINTWSITQIDTLSSLMDSSNGEWDPSLARAIISKYLSVAGNKLGSTELNTIGGANLCSLDVNVLKNISQQSLKEANALTVSNCTIEKKKELFNIAEQAFSGSTRATATLSSYQLTKTYLEGASLEYIKSLVSLNVSMDMAIFTSLQENVVLNLTVNEVKDLLGTNLPELKSYENETLVQTWVRSQLQSELDTLGIGINGGRANPTTTTKSPSTTTSTSSSTSTTTAGSGSSSSTTSTTTGNGTRIRADAGLSLLAVLALLIMSQHIVV
ncbi:uncharacterized protein mslnb isoform X11 [Lates calcarifer]|uniref:Uncharacterized protein mslnb isoform X1 n=2 Tax=Lates calcarifer TaxID=8187 RepID=A0AAJ8DPR2_LATCA|nr:uncharacterized protein mslnb isoform X1 [Lates calcarifer]XP_050926394.1 uncharacterized protein mslnb isoform X2 [Lates calcarifer]XP_050926395.1 uncharacterized protein mslnb isoform X3 [Lates calcarifer]XP_050926396.1 uncharacterized protein mslnb isoform X4 [Lates calcarifer]XP_050926397.1 uncharacterized protein mslnb isoform X5 [Lates calcarifer]XP_050926398.1 uncharacterized protein mslnb isoform X6 [Lates calcarifer]XP_050926399.1 uncharacterized protein mslnb isoform X7 [Lates ca